MSSPPLSQIKPTPSLIEVFTTWLVIGIQSFGGGSATFFLIRQACIKRGWISEEEFLKYWALAQVSPGINLVKTTILIGKRLRGWPGIIASVGGLLLPSALVTGLMTAFYTDIENLPAVRAAMRGVLPATIGLSLAMSLKLMIPALQAAYRESKLRFALHVLILVAAMVVMALSSFSPILILLLAGTLTTLTILVVPANLPLQEEGK